MQSDVIRLVIGFLGSVALLCVGGMVYLAAVGREVPSALVSTAAGSCGALAGILAAQKDRDR